MGMQVHFHIADIPDGIKVHKHADVDPDEGWTDTYIVVDPDSLYFNTDAKHERAWADIGSMGEHATTLLRFLVMNRIPFNAS